MKLRYFGDEPNLDTSLELADKLVNEGVVTDRDVQIQGIYETEIILDDVLPSDKLTEIVSLYDGYRIVTDPQSTDAFAPEEGLQDVDKVGMIQSPNYEVKEDEDTFNISEIELFSDEELPQDENRSLNNFNNQIMARRNFNDPNQNPGVSVEGQQPVVEATQEKDDKNYNPAGEGFESVDVTPFTEEELEAVNDPQVEMDGNHEVKVFSEEEIENMVDPSEVEQIAEDMEKNQEMFSDRQKRLFSAKRRLHRINSKVSDRKSFAEELSEKEQSDVIEDIVAILEDAPEIKDAVMEEIGESVIDTEAEEAPVEETPAEEPVTEEPVVEETVVEETVEETPAEEPAVEETPAESFNEETPTEESETEEPGVEEESELDVEAFSEEEINEAETQVEEEETPAEEPVEEVNEEEMAEEVGNTFCKAFSNNSVRDYRRQVLADMSARMTNNKF